MADEKLIAVLGPDGYAELMAHVSASKPVPAAPSKPWDPLIVGLLKSWTVWFGGILVALPQIIPLISPTLQQALSANAYKNVTTVVGIIVILLRFKTTQSLQAKGNPPGQATTP
jgi:hypothetical protein